MNPLRTLEQFGQSVWLDYIRRGLLTGGGLASLIAEDGVRGVTSNPAIFQKAIAGSSDYTDILGQLAGHCRDAKELYEQIAILDIRDAADVLRAVYDETGGADGFVSLEVSPALARDTEGTVEEARRLWEAVRRPNLMIKVPATAEGIPAVERLVAEGINVNVTLLFSQVYYEKAARAYIAGLERRAAAGLDVSGVASVASFFVSRIDTLVDSRLEALAEGAGEAGEKGRLLALRGRVAVANAKQAYRLFHGLFDGERWRKLAAGGARPQRMLWASTGTKNRAYSDVLYVEELIGPGTVNTMPPATLDAFRDHGKVRGSLAEDAAGADGVMRDLAAAGISIEEVTDTLLEEGVRLFEEPFAKLLETIEETRRKTRGPKAGRADRSLPPELESEVRAVLEQWQSGGKVRRLWEKDPTLWTGGDESKWLGWLDIADEAGSRVDELRKAADDVRAFVKSSGASDILLLGMGGSSLCPEVLSETFGRQAGFPALHVLDSTDPAQVRAAEERIDLARSLFIVASKSGSTLEPTIFMEYFLARLKESVGPAEAPKRFMAVTDPGSKLESFALKEGFAKVYHGVPDVGGRYSALTNFGMVPAAAMGVDVGRFLAGAGEMARACAASVPAAENPGVALGAALGVLAGRGRDKVTLVASPGIRDLGAWLEQLLAESTGKQGRGLIPVDLERLGPPEVYGDDRVFVHLRLRQEADAGQADAVERLRAAGRPVLCVELEDRYDLGREFFRWELATAVAGSVMGLNPFDQPDVEAAKVEARRLTTEYEKEGQLPPEEPILEEGGVRLIADRANAAALKAPGGAAASLESVLKAHLDRLGAGDYFALLAFIEMNGANRDILQEMRHAVRDGKRVATTLGFGPRFLHSTGQAHKGGPNSGVLLQVTCDDAGEPLQVPGHQYTFGIVKAAQARGDFQVLAKGERRILRVHLGHDCGGGLETLLAAFYKALA